MSKRTGYLAPVKRMCKTCPFRPTGYTGVRAMLEARAMQATPICHSTGDSDVTEAKDKTHKESRACRGARNQQLRWMFRLGVISAPTDAAWRAKCKEMNLL